MDTEAQGKVRLGNVWVRDLPPLLGFQCGF